MTIGKILRVFVVLGLIGAGVHLFTGPDPSKTRFPVVQAPTAAPLPPAVPCRSRLEPNRQVI